MATRTRQEGPTEVTIATRDSYVGYKQDTRELIQWMMKTTRFILASRGGTDGDASLPAGVSPSGETNVAGLVGMAKLIAENGAPVSGSIFRRLLSIVRARRSHYAAFTDYVSMFPDEHMEKSNKMHRHFIDSLIEIFQILGGMAWWDKQMEANNIATKPTNAEAEQIEEMKGVVFSNKFATLSLTHGESTERPDDKPSEEVSEEDSEAEVEVVETKSAKKKSSKGKKGKSKKGKPARKTPKAPKRPREVMEETPLDSYRLLEEDDSLMTSFTMAALAFKAEWSQTRNYIQDLWHDVAYEKFNSAIAGGVSNVALAKIKKTELEMFADFPKHNCFESIVLALNRGNTDQLQKLSDEKAARSSKKKCPDCQIDVREQLLLYSYNDLVDFVEDFQKSRSCRPTKAMRAWLGKWNPDFDLKSATKEERIKWRRSFTINWLYDLVNQYSALEHQERGDKCFSEAVDWSPSGPTGQLRKLLGLTDLAWFVTDLVSQKTGTDARRKIPPHIVFQLQCIIDATTVYRGWSLCVHGTHRLEAPDPDFYPMRDVEHFLGPDPNAPNDIHRSHRDQNESYGGYLQGSDDLKGVTKHYTNMMPEHYEYIYHILDQTTDFLKERLGWSDLDCDKPGIPPPRLPSPQSDGVWEFSPYSCGVSLVEALQVAYCTGMRLLDIMPEPVLTTHIECLLSQQDLFKDKGYAGIPANRLMTGLWPHAVWPSRFIPGRNFPGDVDGHLALLDIWEKYCYKRDYTSRWKTQPKSTTLAGGIPCVFPVRENIDFKKVSHLMLYQEAGWDPSKIPDNELEPASAITSMRLSRTPIYYDVYGKRWDFEHTELVQHVNHEGWRDDWQGNEIPVKLGFTRMMEAMHLLRPDFAAKTAGEELTKKAFNKLETILEDLEVAKMDLWNDICGQRGYSAVNFPILIWWLHVVFVGIEKQLFEEKSPSFDFYYKGANRKDLLTTKRLKLSKLIMEGEDKRLKEIAVDQFKYHYQLASNFMYWKNSMEHPLRIQSEKVGVEVPEYLRSLCTVM
ncbi:hypothetical protein CkaCkLH20_03050 [Colletotrichum karsti]|uniref:DUF6604 domain-containing protein n=1 Tax=Colletotrichum karsti TaxID=1095194 RepID=A0A9P6I9U1_9PEZI|nr:uncharacterized protein CkaCkLH20_03050 [Colletotrichum karsti]KAF9879507.1 hypothetical protein CkaCkLH20_03050 [Colletotrichum karsti]